MIQLSNAKYNIRDIHWFIIDSLAPSDVKTIRKVNGEITKTVVENVKSKFKSALTFKQF